MAEQSSHIHFENTNRWSTKQLVTMALMCAVAAIDEFRGRRTDMEQTDDPLAAQLTEKALNDSVAAIADSGILQ